MALMAPPDWKPAVEVRFVMDKSHGRWLVTVRNCMGQGTAALPQVIEALGEVQKALEQRKFTVHSSDGPNDTLELKLDAE